MDILTCIDFMGKNMDIYCTKLNHHTRLMLYYERPHRGCHRQEWFLSTPQKGCSSSGLIHTEWTLPGRRSSASPQRETTGSWARSHHDPAGFERGTTHLTEGKKKFWLCTQSSFCVGLPVTLNALASKGSPLHDARDTCLPLVSLIGDHSPSSPQSL